MVENNTLNEDVVKEIQFHNKDETIPKEQKKIKNKYKIRS